MAFSAFGVRRVTVQDSWIDGFDPNSEFFRAAKLVNNTFHGVHVLLVCVDAGDKRVQAEIRWAATNENQFPLPAALGFNAKELDGSWIIFTGNPKTNVGPFHQNIPAAVWRSWVQSSTNRDGQIWVTTPIEEGSPRYWLQPTNNEPILVEIVSFAQLRPDMLQRVAELSRFIEARRQYAVGGVLSAADYVATTRFMLRPSEESARRLPDNPQQVKALWDQYRLARGAERLRQAIDTNYARSLTTVFLKNANFVDTARLMQEIRAYEREHLAPHGITLSFAGDVAVSQSLIERIVSTQVRSLWSSLVGIWVVVSLLGRSWRGGFYCVVPSALAVVVTFAVMGWAGIPLGVATSMFAGMTLGMGVDFAIHLLEQFQSARRGGAKAQNAVREAVEHVGPAVLINALGVALGFGVLVLSQVPANARLGALVVLGVVNCLVATLMILPVLLYLWPPKAAEQLNR
jgi:predicted RND superfamily exporter protein